MNTLSDEFMSADKEQGSVQDLGAGALSSFFCLKTIIQEAESLEEVQEKNDKKN